MKCIQNYQDGTLIQIVVRPNTSSKKFIQEINEKYILVNINSSPQNGKANKELIKRLAKLLKISTRKISIKAGIKSKDKTIYVELPVDKVMQLLNINQGKE